jgi:hypothetical protein
MTKKLVQISRALLIVGSLFLTMLSARGQSTYYSESYDIYGNIDTDYYGYPTSGTCNNFTVTSSLNGGYSSDAGTYGDVLDAYQSTPGVDGVDYSWILGTITEYPAGPSCGSLSYSYEQYISHRTTSWSNPSIDNLGACQWNTIACLAGTPTCTSGLGVWPSPACPNYVQATYLSVRYLGTLCWLISSIGPLPGPGFCT